MIKKEELVEEELIEYKTLKLSLGEQIIELIIYKNSFIVGKAIDNTSVLIGKIFDNLKVYLSKYSFNYYEKYYILNYLIGNIDLNNKTIKVLEHQSNYKKLFFDSLTKEKNKIFDINNISTERLSYFELRAFINEIYDRLKEDYDCSEIKQDFIRIKSLTK